MSGHLAEDSFPTAPSRLPFNVLDRANALCMQARQNRAHAARLARGVWRCIDCGNESPLGNACQFCCPCACDECSAIGRTEQTAGGDELCLGCTQNAAESAAERQHEANCEAFYGGSEPFTVAEHHEAAFREERGLS